MAQPKIILLLALAILTGTLSLPMKWFTLTGVLVDSAAFDGSVSTLQGATVCSIPVWMLVAIALVASVVQLMDVTGVCDIPTSVKCGMSSTAVLAMSVAIAVPITLQGVTANVGALLGFVSSVIPAVALVMCMKSERTVAA